VNPDHTHTDHRIFEALKDPAVVARFWASVRMTPGCWFYEGTASDLGYGKVYAAHTHMSAHRVSWIFFNGVPDDLSLSLDHLCRTTSCIRPKHLELVPLGVNVMRGNGACAANARKTHCLRGHPFSAENTRIGARGRARVCITCSRAAGRKHDAGRRARKGA